MVRPKILNTNRAIILVLHLCFIVCFQIADAAVPRTPDSNVCDTEACKNIASSILQKMNQSVNPCDNFYDFVCGNFSKNAVIPPTKSVNYLISQLRDLVSENLRNDIEHKITNEDPKAFQTLLTYYKTCMDENQIEKTSNNELLEILNKLGGWPVLLGESYDDSKFDWKASISKISKMGYSGNYILRVYFNYDLKNNTRYLLNINTPVFGIVPEYLEQGPDYDIVKAYFKFMVDAAEILGANREQAKLELEESLKFELELAKIALPDLQLQVEEKFNPMKISELQTAYPAIPWFKCINNWLSPVDTVTEDEVVIMNAPNYVQNLDNLLSRTSKRTQANYVLFRMVLDSVEQLNQKVRDAYFELTSLIYGKRYKEPRWQSCVASVSKNLYVATSSLYVRRNVDKSIKVGVSDMVQRIRQSYETILLEADWMTEKTRNTALEKLEQMLSLVGYPDEVLDDEKIDNYYKNLTLCSKSFLKNFLSYNQFQHTKRLIEFRKPISRLDWTKYNSASYIVNCFYTPDTNVIRILAGFLQGDIYNKYYPEYVNFATAGSLIGHEMTHALDNTGRRFDEIGNLVNWWDEETKKKFLQKAQCIVDQYSNYTVSQINSKINGYQTEDENIADNGGIKESYLAYEAYEKENGVEAILPGFESFTTKQLFWISNANIYCTKYRDEYLRNAILTDVHSPNPFRVIGPMSNNPHFAEDFNCPIGSPMNPENKCSVW